MKDENAQRLDEYRRLIRHPVYSLIAATAGGNGETPSEAELDALELPAEIRRELAKVLDEIAGLKRDGENQAARGQVQETAATIVAKLAPEQRDPDYLKPPDMPGKGGEDYDPVKLAEGIQRW